TGPGREDAPGRCLQRGVELLDARHLLEEVGDVELVLEHHGAAPPPRRTVVFEDELDVPDFLK
ncbi:MAG TPA: hypothetical protein VM433_04420, partial [Mycobacteriales bacterium]|nr:hypothetical protein [Mycobacteriales bacterium]